ncbi:phospholipid-transporting ATPase VA isoform X1 [Anopheles aquasalis]|uniref:phospholipid-transporting ATPase VA isoform X1 n=1 Tax=Anopheles aquasalis TaxID=42839 RepID=UPI00215A3B69|nr:phospholipid-transporting ATPase VA isoform X1 [Anopheles aquasalis]XP_050100214.1 phospholipid-transporting ATPase VA isoform X1 [Anopheles aquasalis]
MTQKEETFSKPAAPSGDGGGGGGTSSLGLAIGSFPSHQQPSQQQQQQQPASLLTPHQEHPLESVASQTTYMFTGDPLAHPVTTAPSTSRILLDGYPRSATSSGHSRSISHGEGGSFGGHIGAGGLGGVGGHAGRPSALKSAVKGGHQRALSQGQIMDTPTHAARGHSRVGSKTDFILPPGHKEPTESRDRDTTHLGVPHSATSTTSKGHSRQASRSESIYTLRRANKPPWWKRFWFCRLRSSSSKLEDRGYRIVVPNHTVPPKTPKRDHPNGRLCGNKIRTTKYTLLSFVPKNLLEQFHRIANLYFIFIVLLNWFPQINAFGKEIAMIPVLFVLGVTAIKDLFEDRRRKASDKRINNSTCRVYNGESERYKKVLWQDIRVGDLVHLSNNETVPADILLLKSSDPHGMCYIDTCDLDGETNLKRRQVVRGFVEKQHIFTPNKFTSRIEVDAPSTKIYRFHGAVIHPSGERVPVSTESLLLRESRLKNTDYAEGIVVYAGHETKAMLNNSGPRYKRSRVEQQMNIDVIWCVIILIVLCVIGAVGCRMWLSFYADDSDSNEQGHGSGNDTFRIPFLPFEISPDYEGLLAFWTFVIILQIMIPLSLYVTIELCKLMQVYHIHNNIELYDPDTNKRTECRAMNITEELGQIQYVFSDKTGTLTENRMIFRRCTIVGVDYNHPETEEEKELNKIGAPVPILQPNVSLLENFRGEGVPAAGDRSMIRSGEGDELSQQIQEFFLVLAICNTVVVSAAPHKDNMNASGVIEMNDSETSVTLVRPALVEADGVGTSLPLTGCDPSTMGDRYARLTESRSITPSPPPNAPTSLPLKATHVPSLSPISSSAETSPMSESPPMRIKSLTTPTARVKSLVAKLGSVASGSSKGGVFKSADRNSTGSMGSTKNRFTAVTKFQKSSSQGSSSPADRRPIYEAESPDELALVNAAFSYDCCLVNRSPNHVLVSVPREGVIEFEVLKVLPFDSSRKCMSVVVRRTGTQELVLYTKGADSSIMPNLVPCQPGSEEYRLREQTQHQLNIYARQGLRVLVMAKRKLDPTEFSEWYSKHQECELSMENRERKIRDSFILLERNLSLVGTTGIEDRLQEGVPEAINSLLQAGIVIWVLTGDKAETAINIAYSAKLFNSQMDILRLTARSRDSAEACINFYLNEIEKQLNGGADGAATTGGNRTITADGDSDAFDQLEKPRALVVDGKTLTFILDLRSNLTKPFLRLTRYCSSVLCCRATPLQKAFLVKVVKEELRISTLAIGDGANDVSMIQMADVGVGICGQEGMQAVMASDFSIAKFKLLERLLLVHGHWNYDRLARMITYFFYKNAAFVFLLFWYQFFCGFSGAVMIDEVYLMIYNLLFTALPPLAIGVYDKKIIDDLLLSYPRLYQHGRRGKGYKWSTFWIVMLDALYQSLVIFFVALAAYWGTDVDIWVFGTTITSSCLFTMLLHCAIEIKSWTILHALSIGISLVSFYAFAFAYNSVCVSCFGLPSNYWVIHMSMSTIQYYLITLLTSVLALLPRFTYRVIKNSVWPCEGVRVTLQYKEEKRRGENLLVTWSRSTSASSIFRASHHRTTHKTVIADNT